METAEVKSLLLFSVLEKAEDDDPVTLCRIEERWRNNLSSCFPLGLNTRDDGPKELRKKNLLRYVRV